MKGITTYKGKVALLDRSDVDTDQIMPKQFLKRIERTGFGQFVFYEWRSDPNFELNKYPNSTILVTGPNFGCGSSREHAVWGLKEFGFQIIISPSFADIFYFNAVENMLLPCTITLENYKKLVEKIRNNNEYYLTVDLQNQKIYDDFGFTIDFIIDPQSKERLIKGWDSIDLVLQFEDKIREYEKARNSFMPNTSKCGF